jgi:hypothetical protein
MTDRGSITAQALRPRGAARHKLFEPLGLRHAGQSMRVHMLDLSVSGALLHAEHPPRIGAGVIIEFQGLAATAHVMWVRAKRFGVRFDMPLPDTALRAMLDGGGAACP